MDTGFHPTLYSECNYSSMLRLKLNHVSKGGNIVNLPANIYDISFVVEVMRRQGGV